MDDFGLLVSQYNATLPTLSDGQLRELQVDDSGRLIIAGRFLSANDSYAADDSGISILAVRQDADTVLSGVADGEYSPLQVDENGRLKVVCDIEVSNGHEKAEDAAHGDGDIGSYVLAVRADSRPTNANTTADGDYASFFVNANGELYVHDTDVLAQLVTIDAVLDTIKADTATIASDTTSIDATLTALSKAEDAAHGSGDQGIMALAVRNDAGGSLVDTDGDYASLQLDSSGNLRIAGEVTLQSPGSEQYSVTDALAAAGDGLETITAAATPWVTVASLAVGAGTTAYVYGWQWACDQNAQARLVTDDTTDVVVYKTTVNSSSQPGKEEHWAESGRIEIAGAASLEIKLQIKKRSSTGGNANGTGSFHARTL